jgi:hypothetical protein
LPPPASWPLRGRAPAVGSRPRRPRGPSQAEEQKKTGKYAKGKFTWNGLTIAIETPKDAVRSGKDKDGKAWSIVLKDHYGYFNRTVSGADDDPIDVFVCEDTPESELVFVVNQNDPTTGTFDEHKVILGTYTAAKAEEVYRRNYAKGWKGFGSLRAMTLPDFKKWLTTEPEKAAQPKKTAETPEEFWARNDAAKEKDKHSFLPHVRDGYIPCGACGFNYHEMPDDETCLKCGGKLGIRLRSMKRAQAKNVYSFTCRLVKRAEDSDRRPFTIAFDLDGTLAEKEEPFNPDTIGDPIPEAVEYARRFQEAGARIIIFTVRGNKRLVRKWLDRHDVSYDYINENPDQPADASGKVLADVYIDDRAVNGENPAEYGPEVLQRIEEDNPRTNNEPHGVLVVRQRTIIFAPTELLHLLEGANDANTETGTSADRDTAPTSFTTKD